MEAIKNEIAKEVKKPVEAIQCSNNFSLIQRKMYNALLANAASNLRPEVTHRIYIGILCKMMGYNSHDYKIIKDSFRALMDIKIEWDILNENGNKTWAITTPLSFAKVTEREGVCEYEFTKSLIPYLDRPAQYAKFSLIIQSKFKSSYGLALYENCERYRKIRHTRAYDIPTFRKLMGLKESEYKEFWELKRRVINPAIKDVNQNADFNIEPECEKIGKQIIKIRFIITPKKELVENQGKENKIAKESELCIILGQVFNLSENEVEEIFKKHDVEYINEKVNYVLTSSTYQKGEVDNMAAYLKSALRDDYKPQKSSKDIKKEIKEKEELLLKQQQEKDKELSHAKSEYSHYSGKSLIKIISDLEELSKNDFELSFENYLKENKDKFVYSSYRKKGYQGSGVLSHLKDFTREFYPAMYEEILPLQDYLRDHFPNAYAIYRELNANK